MEKNKIKIGDVVYHTPTQSHQRVTKDNLHIVNKFADIYNKVDNPVGLSINSEGFNAEVWETYYGVAITTDSPSGDIVEVGLNITQMKMLVDFLQMKLDLLEND